MLGLMAPLLTHAAEPSVCTSMCTSEKEQCTSRAGKLTDLDSRPSVGETNPFARTANNMGQVESDSARVTERFATQRRNRERTDACNTSYKRCTSSCAQAIVPVIDQAAPGR
jgi:hypothetical protein